MKMLTKVWIGFFFIGINLSLMEDTIGFALISIAGIIAFGIDVLKDPEKATEKVKVKKGKNK